MSKESDKKTLPAGSHHPIAVPPAQGTPPAAVTLWPPFPENGPKPTVPSSPPGTAVEAAEPASDAPSELPEPTKTRKISLPVPSKREPHPHELDEMLPIGMGDRPSPEPFSILDGPLAQPAIEVPPPVLPLEEQPEVVDQPPAQHSAPDEEEGLGPPALQAVPMSAPMFEPGTSEAPSPESVASSDEPERQGSDRVLTTLERVRDEELGRWRAIDPRRRKLMIGVAAGVGGLAVLSAIALAILPPTRTRPATTASAEPPAASPPPRESSAAPEQPAASASASPSALAAPAAAGPCVPSGDPVQLSPKASKDVAVELRADKERSELAVGFAADDRTAVGLVLDLATLQVKDRFHKASAKVARVVPVTTDKGFAFEVHAQGKGVRAAQSLVLTTTPPMLVTWKAGTLKVGPLDGEAAASQDLEDKIASVRAVAAPGVGAAIAARAGESVKLAWVDESGKAVGTPTRIDSPATHFGSPSLAWNGDSALVAFAERDGEDTPWGIRLATAAFGAGPRLNRTWEAPAGGPGGAAMAPSVASLDAGAWLMVWTEGTLGQRQVRMQTWDKELKALDSGRTVSGSGNAGQGSGVVAAGRGIVVFLTGTKGHALWGTGISCQ